MGEREARLAAVEPAQDPIPLRVQCLAHGRFCSGQIAKRRRGTNIRLALEAGSKLLDGLADMLANEVSAVPFLARQIGLILDVAARLAARITPDGPGERARLPIRAGRRWSAQ